MSDKVPLLNLQQIEELTNMVRSIQIDNTKALETILAETVEIERTTILTLYNLVVEEWNKKQTVIDNLCHFTLTMMSTVEMLWNQRYDQDDKLSNAEVVIQHLSKNIYQLGDQNEEYKLKIKEAEIKLSFVTEQKQRIQQLYRSQSCIGFNEECQGYNLKTLNKHCSACSQVDIRYEEKDVQTHLISEKLIEEKLQELSEALDQKKQLQEEFNLLKQQHDLTRMELELAELAIKDALSYKHSYLSLISNVNETSKSKEQFNENDHILEDAQEMIQNVYPLKAHILANELPLTEALELQSLCKQYDQPQNNQLSNSSDFSLVKLYAKEQKRTTHQSPFKKREEKSKFSKDMSNELSIQYLAQDSKVNNKRSIFEYQNHHQDSSIKINQTFHSNAKIAIQENPPLEKETKDKSSVLLLKKEKRKETEIKKKDRRQKQKQVNSSQSSLGKLYTLIANKLVTNRIKTK